MYKLFGYGLKGIPYINRLKRRVFYAVVITVVALNIFISFSLNLRSLTNEKIFNSFIVADLQNNLNQDKKNEIEKYILGLNGVRSVRFMDKFESFKNLQNELNISIPESSNPLTDSLIISVKDPALLGQIQETVEAREEVKEVYKDESYLKQSKEQGFITSIAQIGSGVFSFFIALITIIIFNFGVAIEFLNNANTGLDYAENIRKSKIRNLLSFTMSTVIGTLIFFNIYVLFRKYVSHAKFDSSMLSLKEIILWHLGAIAILNLLVWLIPANVGRIEYAEEEDDDDDELDDEFYEDEEEDGDYDDFEDDED
ncbi:ABC transporter permease [Fusobacterium canifelinum]|uniref:ABC transporter permease n=1 Tax=Fusobacterium canifelinum TaxID=285729 RepID=A0ABX7CJ27_9FUSO|nr:ABC transporter permease [Fusobacterium canifelinum]QQS88335.1 ABC transporter permease [Fusobacterium canifelinum]